MRDYEGIELRPELEAELRELLRAGCPNSLVVKEIVETTGVSIGEAIGWIESQYRKDTPCPFCGKPLRTAKAKQCFDCGADWHSDPPAAST